VSNDFNIQVPNKPIKVLVEIFHCPECKGVDTVALTSKDKGLIQAAIWCACGAVSIRDLNYPETEQEFVVHHF
jgi:transcription elongation factor Elf1